MNDLKKLTCKIKTAYTLKKNVSHNIITFVICITRAQFCIVLMLPLYIILQYVTYNHVLDRNEVET